MKKILALILAVMVMLSCAAVLAEGEDTENIAEETMEEVYPEDSDPSAVKVYINGSRLRADVPAQIINDRTMIPMRAIFEALKCDVTWISEQRSIIATRNGDENTSAFITMGIDNPAMSVIIGNSQPSVVTLDVPPQIVDDRTLVPVRAVSEALKCTVEWDGETRSVYITE